MSGKKVDFLNGIAIADVPSGRIVRGTVGSEDAILIRRNDEFFIVGAQCSHYHGELADGLIAEDTIRCPLHHACFSLRTGSVLRAPALDAIACWRSERVGEQVYARDKLEQRNTPSLTTGAAREVPASVLIVGGGAAGLAAADMLRRENYAGPITMISADGSAPYIYSLTSMWL